VSSSSDDHFHLFIWLGLVCAFLLALGVYSDVVCHEHRLRAIEQRLGIEVPEDHQVELSEDEDG
jgi:hypothetical protein